MNKMHFRFEALKRFFIDDYVAEYKKPTVYSMQPKLFNKLNILNNDTVETPEINFTEFVPAFHKNEISEKQLEKLFLASLKRAGKCKFDSDIRHYAWALVCSQDTFPSDYSAISFYNDNVYNISYALFKFKDIPKNELYFIPDCEYFGALGNTANKEYSAFCFSDYIVKLKLTDEQINKIKKDDDPWNPIKEES